MIPSRLSVPSILIGLSLFATSAFARFAPSSSSASSEPVACTMEAKLCPDGKTYVGRDSNNNCAFSPCPGESSSSSSMMACTKEAKICSDGVTTVGRTGPNCEFEECPAVDPCPFGVCASEMQRCAPYMCEDGTRIPKCATDGTVINYFAPPCLTHGGDAGPFTDVPANHANANAIAYLKTWKFVQGYADGTFKPDATINRAEFVKILMAIKWYGGGMCSLPEHAFSDTDSSAWYAYYICEAKRDEIIEGYSDGTFRPAGNINFAEAAKIIVNTLDIATDAGHTAPLEPWYAPYVIDLEVYKAIPLTIDSFDQKLTRGEMAEIVWRAQINGADLPWETGPHTIDLPSKTYQEIVGHAAVGEGCVIGGCSAEVCTNEGSGNVVSNCIYRPEFACYKAATCEKQASGSCGWTQTDELRQCLAGAR